MKRRVASASNIRSALIFAGLLSLPLGATGQAPKPPSLLCIGAEDCQTTTTLDSGSAAKTGKKWNPGHYVKHTENYCRATQDQYFASIEDQIRRYAFSSPEIKGLLVRIPWGMLETQRGSYRWDRIRSLFDVLDNKQLLVEIEKECFGVRSGRSAAHIMPRDLRSKVEPTNGGVIARYWERGVADRVIEFMRAFAAQFDDHPQLESVSFGSESCPSFGRVGAPSDYHHSAGLAQLERIYSAQADAFRQTIVMAAWNCAQGGTLYDGIETAYQLGMGRLGPDAHADQGFMAFMGKNDAVRDYRGLLPHQAIVSAPNLGGKDDILPLSNIQKNQIDRGRITHVAWITYDTRAGTFDDVLRHIESGRSKTYEECPQRIQVLYGGCR